jgi:hypothetical protein
MKAACVAGALLSLLLVARIVCAADLSYDDAYLTGYATAVLERELQLRAPSLTVRGGVVSVDAADLRGVDGERVTAALARIPGIVRVDVISGPPPPGAPTAAEPPGTPTITSRPARDFQLGLLPGGQLFRPLIADPRWPHFAAAYQYYSNEDEIAHVGAVSFGETFTLYRERLGPGWWELGVQAGVFAVFDLAAESKDLINADYMVGAVLGYRQGDFSALGRLFHQSSHIGDEFLLANRVRNRVNVSYESVDLRVSYDFFDDALRVYGGGGVLFDQEPASLDPWSAQWGVEFRSPWPGPTSAWRPIAAIDMQNRQENDWAVDISLRGGVQFEGVLAGRSLQLLLEYFRGHSPNGQFYNEKVDYFGVGVHFNF